MTIPDRAVYPTQPVPLRNKIDELLKAAPSTDIDGEILAVIVPDTNQVDGGSVAARVYRCLKGESFETVILVAPSHTGSFARMNICSVDSYRTPLGELRVSDRVRNELCDEDDDIFLDDLGHYHIEGIDVQLPYLQLVLEDFDIVPIVMGDESPDFCRELGAAIGEMMLNRPTLVIATADIVDASEGALEQMLDALSRQDVERLMVLANSEQVKIEGKGPLLVAMIAAASRKATNVDVLEFVPPGEDGPGFLGAVVTRG